LLLLLLRVHAYICASSRWPGVHPPCAWLFVFGSSL
jgi:hypothetical protein